MNNLKYDLTIPSAFYEAKLKPTALSVAINMLLFADFKTGKLQVGYKKLAEKCCVSKRVIPAALKELEDKKVINIDLKGDGYTATKYTILAIAKKNKNKKNIAVKNHSNNSDNSGLIKIEGKEYSDLELIEIAMSQVDKPKNSEGLKNHLGKCINRGIVYDNKLIRGSKTDALLLKKFGEIDASNPLGLPVNPLSIR